MRCVAALVSAETGKTTLEFETAAGLIPCWRADGGLFTVDMGRPRLRWDEIPLAAGRSPIRARSISDRSARRAGPALAVGRQHGQSACDFLGRRSAELTICAASARVLEHDPIFPERANITLAATAVARSRRDPHLGARRRPHQGLRLGGLRRRGRRGAARPHRPQGDGDACRAAISPSNGARATTMC